MILEKFIDKAEHYSHSKFALFSFFGFPNTKLDAYLDSIKSKIPEENYSKIQEIQNSEPVYGIGKIRGVFDEKKNADDFAANMIYTTECDESIYTVKIGYPFLVASKGFSSQVENVDINEKLTEHQQKNVKKQKHEIEKIKEKEESLKTSSEKDSTDKNDLDNYIMNRVKLAHLRHTVEKTNRQIEEYQVNILKCKAWLRESQQQNPTFLQEYLDRYLEARKEANIPNDSSDTVRFLTLMKDPID